MLPDQRPPIEYATKADLEHLRLEIRADMAQFRVEIRADMAALKADVELLRQQIRGDIAEQIGALQKTMLTLLISMTAIFGGLVTILKLFG